LQPGFHISDQEFRVGLFQDIEHAIAHPGEEADFNGSYVTHRDYHTSRLLNDFLADRAHREFLVDGRGGCWRLRIEHRWWHRFPESSWLRGPPFRWGAP